MKTETDMLCKAMEIVNNNPNAFVGFFYPNYQQVQWGAKTVLDNLEVWKGATYSRQTNTYTAHNGSKLLLRAISPNNYHESLMCQFSHIFVWDVDYECKLRLMVRVRSKHKFDFPMGLYENSGAPDVWVPYN